MLEDRAIRPSSSETRKFLTDICLLLLSACGGRKVKRKSEGQAKTGGSSETRGPSENKQGTYDSTLRRIHTEGTGLLGYLIVGESCTPALVGPPIS